MKTAKSKMGVTQPLRAPSPCMHPALACKSWVQELGARAGFTMVELIIAIIIAACFAFAVFQSLSNYTGSAALESSAQKLYADLAEIRLYTVTGRWVSGIGGLELFNSTYKTMIDTSFDCSQAGGSAPACLNFRYLKSNSSLDNSARSEDMTFESHVQIDASSMIKEGNMIFFDCNGLPYFSTGCGVSRVPMGANQTDIVLIFNQGSISQTKTIHIDPATGKITIL